MKTEHYALSPWLTIWFYPRTAIKRIAASDSISMLILLAVLAGISIALNVSLFMKLGDRLSLPFVILISVMTGSFGGIIILMANGFLLFWTGRWFGGKASVTDVQSTIAGASIPISGTLLLLILLLFLYGNEVFSGIRPTIDLNPAASFILSRYWLLVTIIAVWQVVLFIKGFSEVHGLSISKSISSTLLGLFTVIMIGAIVSGFAVSLVFIVSLF
ncbi:YIP1 family protein [candidate division KSB1 bacterium]